MKNHTPVIVSSHGTSHKDFTVSLDEIKAQRPASLLIMACSDNDFNLAGIEKSLRQCDIPVCGGVFPQLVNEHTIYDTGFIMVGLPFDIHVYNYRDLSRRPDKTAKIFKKNNEGISEYHNFLIFADALCDTNEDFIHHFYEHIGSDVNVVGGGTGSLEFTPKPCIFTNEGMISDAVQIAGLSGELSRNIGHGWEVFDGPYLVTSAQGHRVETLDYRPAFEVYRNAIERLSGSVINQDNFFEIAKNFPLGIVNINGEVLVRDPITTDSSFLECVGNVPANATINILRGDEKKLLDSSRHVANTFKPLEKSNMLLLFDCISRILYLKEQFDEEISELKKTAPELPLIGALSLGEITNSHYGSIDLLNKSTVIGML